MNTKTPLVILIIAIFIGGAGFWAYIQNKKNVPEVRTFEECAAFGYPVLESYPRQCRTPNGQNFIESVLPPTTVTSTPPVQEEDFSDLIQVSEPIKNAKISSPVKIKGKARGTWYFEASFPVTITDANGVSLGVVPIQAKGDWMTTDFVPFEASISFTTPTTPTGFIVFEKDNPSGLPQNAKEYKLPIKF